MRRDFLLLQLVVKIEFHPDKDAANRHKHGLSVADAERMDLGTALIDLDRRYAYGGDRFQALGQLERDDLSADSGSQFASELGSRSSESRNRALKTKTLEHDRLRRKRRKA